MSRTDVFESTGPTCGTYIKLKMGATKDGLITAAQAYMAYEAGGYPGSPIGAGCMCVFSPYKIENGRIDGYDVVVNKPKTAAYRAPGAPNAAFATETVIDEICEKLGIEPIEFRLRNAVKEGDRRVDGPVFPRIGFVEVLEATKNHPHYSAPLEESDLRSTQGGAGDVGWLPGFWFNVGLQSSCNMSVNPDGTVNLIEGSTDIGGTRVAVAMQAAEVLGIAAEEVKPTVADTDSVGFTMLTGGSRTAFATGWVAYEAAQQVKTKMIERAAKIWDASVDDVEYDNGAITHKSDPELRFSFKELAEQLLTDRRTHLGERQCGPEGRRGGLRHGDRRCGGGPGYRQGGCTEVHHGAGRGEGGSIPAMSRARCREAPYRGIGWALNEEYFFNDKGEMVNSSFLDYRMPTSLDVPMIDTVIVEVANPGHPYGARGVGEVPIVPPLPAIANAVYNAIGVRMRDLPMSPGKVLEALWDKDGK